MYTFLFLLEHLPVEIVNYICKFIIQVLQKYIVDSIQNQYPIWILKQELDPETQIKKYYGTFIKKYYGTYIEKYYRTIMKIKFFSIMTADENQSEKIIRASNSPKHTLFLQIPLWKIDFKEINVVRRQAGSKKRCTKCKKASQRYYNMYHISKKERWGQYHQDIKNGYKDKNCYNQHSETTDRQFYDWDTAYKEYLSVKPLDKSRYHEEIHTDEERRKEIYECHNGRYHVFFDSEYWCRECENSGYQRLFYGDPNIVLGCR